MNRWFKIFSPVIAIGCLVSSATALFGQGAIAPGVVASSSPRSLPKDLTQGMPALPEPFPTLSTPQIDRQLELYLRYVAEQGRPDILIVGSSRALQGVDPAALQGALGKSGYQNLKVFNFGINGATAQVVKLLLAQVLTSAQMPRVILWADGARAFNSGRADRTYQKMTHSPGYEKLQTQQYPQLVPYLPEENELSITDPRALMGLNIVTEQFVPNQYFQKFPKVPGRYDGDYQRFSLDGEQTQALEDLLKVTRERRVPLVFVNLPLTDLYLDRARSEYERDFRRYKRRFADRGQLTFFDLGRQWVDRYEYFADPSHLNQIGAEAVANELGTQMADYLERRLGMPKQQRNQG
jgi:hypothetical protein